MYSQAAGGQMHNSVPGKMRAKRVSENAADSRNKDKRLGT